ncbi:fructose-6-phosphate aldolase [Aerococcus kribbianus]|uniref:Fructose-6-phosphate aldolase n=1 Tax=Aerococcus kribbianus TaxID=2999064 RepID=A0A9X3FPI7_9LACT|nr:MULTISPECIES: fructose-6-phosphate aldolase [unclassified Aerococcus]MCZ0717608.1 fructose-6-phosphate aldolase [Aerococcus sp. YH-aer221]MCZ0725896.1 fructose-6-phosphate aldolase [Aerococcus sp. YH-aer222]
MNLIIDSANTCKIKDYLTYLPVVGVTTNPSILKKEGNIDVIEHLTEIRNIIGKNRTLHVQTIASDYTGMMEDAKKIAESIGKDVYIKIPCSKTGLKVIKELKNEGYNITATAIYSEIQALLALANGADYLAPYVNRMENLNTNPYTVISNIRNYIDHNNHDTKILAASFKNVNQVLESLHKGAHTVTVGAEVVDKFLDDANINKAITDFSNDWEEIHGNLNI